MTTEQRERILELRQLRRINDYQNSSEIADAYWSSEVGEKLNTLIIARRTLSLHIKQSEGITTYELRRSWNIKYLGMNKDWPGLSK